MLHTGLSISCILSYCSLHTGIGTLRDLREEVVERDSCSAAEQLIDLIKSVKTTGVGTPQSEEPKIPVPVSHDELINLKQY